MQSQTHLFLTLNDSETSAGRLKNSGDLFAQHFYGYDCWLEPTFIQRIQRKFIRGHLWMYDFESLKDILHAVGFSIVQRCQPGEGRLPDIEYLDIHRIGSLFIEVSDV